MKFDGKTYDKERDGPRLSSQLGRVFAVMRDGRWRTLRDLSSRTPGGEAALSARLRDIRKGRVPGWTMQSERIDDRSGLWRYRVVPAVSRQGKLF